MYLNNLSKNLSTSLVVVANPISFFCKRRATESSSCKIQISSKPRHINESTHSVYGGKTWSEFAERLSNSNFQSTYCWCINRPMPEVTINNFQIPPPQTSAQLLEDPWQSIACTRALQNQHRLFATKTQGKQLPKACAPSKTPWGR